MSTFECLNFSSREMWTLIHPPYCYQIVHGYYYFVNGKSRVPGLFPHLCKKPYEGPCTHYCSLRWLSEGSKSNAEPVRIENEAQ